MVQTHIVASAITTVSSSPVGAMALPNLVKTPVLTLWGDITGTGAVSATIELYGNKSPAVTGGVLLATITLSGTTFQSDASAFTAPYPYLYAKVTAISGTGATVNVFIFY